MTSQILPFVPPEFSVIMKMTSHFFFLKNYKKKIRDPLKTLKIVQTTYKQIPHFFTDYNLITNLCLVHKQLHLSIVSLLIDTES